jgi:ethanolamine ammonia-lyase small subunit
VIDVEEIVRITADVVNEYLEKQNRPVPVRGGAYGTDKPVSSEHILPLPAITRTEGGAVPAKAFPGAGAFKNPDALSRMKGLTRARIGVGSAGPRLRTGTLLRLRADHAAARDSVFRDVSAELLRGLGMPLVQSRCSSRQEHITRPDLGRRLSDEGKALLQQGERDRDVQVIAADGLSSTAVEANLSNLWLVLENGLRSRQISFGKPFFVRYGRVAIEDECAELLGAKLVCILIGERPGLATAESLSAYLCYGAKVGQPESRRTVVSNIHSGGIPAAEAGAYLVDLIEKILQKKASGVDFKR